MKSRGRLARFLSLLSFMIVSPVPAAVQVLPVVVTGVPGTAGSFWDSEVRIVKLSPDATVTVRRAWVALSGGGFQEDPASAPSWTLPPSEDLTMLILRGADLLAGVGSRRAAIGLDVEGEADIFLHVANTEGAPPLEDNSGVPCCLPGNGQLQPAQSTPLQGQSRATWITTGADTSLVSQFRANVGIVNPNSTPLRLYLQAFPFSASDPAELRVWRSGTVNIPITTIDVPAWGWIQANNSLVDGPMCWPGLNPVCWGQGTPFYWSPKAFAFRLVPQSDLPYYAYISVIYSPANDPEFVPVLPGGLGVPAP